MYAEGHQLLIDLVFLTAGTIELNGGKMRDVIVIGFLLEVSSQ